MIVPHQKAALFTARRAELVDVMDQMLYYLKVQIYLPYSDVPRLVSYLLESIVCRSQYPMQDSLMNLILINVLSYWWFIIVLFYIL